MTSARLSARMVHQCQRVVLRLDSADAGTLAIETVHLRDPFATARALAFVERAEDLLADGTLDVLYVDPDGADTISQAFGV